MRVSVLRGNLPTRAAGLTQSAEPVIGLVHNRRAPGSAAPADGAPVVPAPGQPSTFALTGCGFAAPVGMGRGHRVMAQLSRWQAVTLRFPPDPLWEFRNDRTPRGLTDRAAGVLGSGHARSDPGRT